VSHVWYSIEKSNGTRARIVGQGDPKTRDRPASENGISPLNVALYPGGGGHLANICIRL
jgi:hypothetical protein